MSRKKTTTTPRRRTPARKKSPARRRKGYAGRTSQQKKTGLVLAAFVFRIMTKWVEKMLEGYSSKIGFLNSISGRTIGVLVNFLIYMLVSKFKILSNIRYLRDVAEVMFFISLADYVAHEFNLYNGFMVAKPVSQNRFSGIMPASQKMLPTSYNGLKVRSAGNYGRNYFSQTAMPLNY